MEKRIRFLLDQLEEKFRSGEIDEVTYEDLTKTYLQKLSEIEEEKASKEKSEKVKEKEEKTLEEGKIEQRKLKSLEKEIPITLHENLEIKRRLLQFSKERSIYAFKLYQLSEKIKKKGGGLKKWPQVKEYQNKINNLNQKVAAHTRFLEENQPKIMDLYTKSRDLKGKLFTLEKEIKKGDTTYSLRTQKTALEKEYMETAKALGEEIKEYKTYLQILKDKLQEKKKELKEKKDHPEKLREEISALQTHINLLSSDIVKFSSILPPKIIQKIEETNQKSLIPLLLYGEKKSDSASKEKGIRIPMKKISAPEKPFFDEPKSKEPPEKSEDISALLKNNDAIAAWDIVDKIIADAQKRFIGFTGPPLLHQGSITIPILIENEPSHESLDRVFETMHPGSFESDSEQRKEYLRSEISSFLKIPEYIALLPRYIRNYCAKKNIKCPLKPEEFKQKIKGIISFQKIKRENGTIIANENDINLLNTDQRKHLAKMKIVPFPISKIEEKTLTKKPLTSHLQKHLGTIIEILNHPNNGAILVYEAFYPDKKILDQTLKNLKKSIKNDYEEKLWYLRFSIAKKLNIGEGDALKPEILAKFCLLEQIPLPPHEVISGYLKWVFMGFISETMKDRVILKRNAFQKPIKHAYPVACKKVVDQEENPLGTAIGITIEKNENGEELVLQYSTKTLEETALEEFEEEEKTNILNTLKESTETALCPETIIKYAIEKGIITEKENYNQLLELLGTKTIPLKKIIKITNDKIYIQT